MSAIIEKLQHPDPHLRKQAVEEAIQQPASPEILAHIERLAANDPEAEVRASALEALNAPNLRALRSQRLLKINANEQRFILDQLDEWQKQGLLGEDQARVLHSRYQVVFKPVPATPAPAVTQATPEPESAPQPTAPPQPLQPRPSLAQLLLSETAIKTFLYLGAFFVIAAAVILAALVEVLRLPILSLAVLAFGGTAVALKKRLPQPSFVLFIVFSSLLPINARVFADLVNLQGQFLAAYWTFVLLVCTAIWAFATRFYNSRFFSLTALGAFVYSSGFVPGIFATEPAIEARMFTVQFANLAGLAGIFLLTRKKDWQFAQPAFLFSQLISLFLVASLGINTLFNLLETEPGLLWVASSTTWLLVVLYYAASHLLKPFPLFPWFASAALAPVVFLFQFGFEFTRQTWALGLGWTIWAFTLTALSEITYRFDYLNWLKNKTRGYPLPLSLAGIALFLFGGFWGVLDSAFWGFALFLAAGILLGLAHLLRQRGWVWLAALVYGLFAYFIFFNLPFLPDLVEYLPYQITLAAILLTLPDIVLRPSWKAHLRWFLPVRGLAIFIGAVSLLFVLASSLSDLVQSAVCAVLLSGAYWLYAIRYNKAWFGYLPGLLFALGLAFAFGAIHERFEIRLGFAAISGLAVVYYLAGWTLERFFKLEAWSRTLRWTGLVLTPILALAALIGNFPLQGWLVGLLALPFIAETRRHPKLEIFAPLVLAFGFSLVLFENNFELSYQYLAGMTVLWLATDYLYKRILPTRPLSPLTYLGAGLLILATTYALLSDKATPVLFASSLGLTLFLLGYALLYRKPQLGYAFTVYLSISTWLLAHTWLNEAWWPWALILLAVGYYVVSLGLGLFAQGWSRVLRFSGVGLGTLTSFGALTTGPSVAASIPIAIAASLWAVEAFRRRNVWLGFPTNALYLTSYFSLLVSLEVTQAQFYSTGAALLGLLMHYLLTRTGSDKGAFLTGLVSQLVLLGTTYIQMVATEQLGYFAALFFQALAVLVYGLVVRSRSLVGVPIAMLVLGVTTIVLFILRGLSTVILIGCTGIVMILLATLAVVLRERLAQLGERLSGWRA
jgi:hypothetical protein